MESITYSEREFQLYVAHPPNFNFISEDFPLATRAERSFRGPLPKTVRKIVKQIFRLHFNRHPLFPNDQTRTFLSQSDIYSLCVKEVYMFCKENELDALCVYPWRHWYVETSWVLWALSENESSIPLSRTTSFLESHWRALKRDHLFKNNRAVCT